MTEPRYVGNSEVHTFKECRRRWALTYVLQVQPRSAVALTGHLALGTRVHRALQVAREGGDALAELERVAALERAQISAPVALVYDAADGPADVDMDALARSALAVEHAAEVELAGIMVKGYLSWLEETGADAGTVLVGTERAVTVPLAGRPDVPAEMQHVVLRGRLDTQVDLPDGRRMIQDYKTTASIERERKWDSLNSQWLFYCLLERMSSEHTKPVAGVVVDRLRKVKRTVRSKPPYYDRSFVTHSDAELRIFFRQTIAVVLDMLALEGKLAEPGADLAVIAYPSPTADCPWRCAHFQACNLMNAEDRWQSYIQDNYISVDPGDRYTEEEAAEG